MPRAAGQIDVAKNEAILDAAVEVWAERGLAAPMEEIARRAGVSKQTIYNHYGSKAELVRALAERRVHEITAALDAPEAALHPLETLTAYGRVLLRSLLNPRSAAVLRMAMLGAPDQPDVGRAMFEAGPRASRRKLAAYLALENETGRLSVPDPLMAAEFFGGMVLGSHQTAMLLGAQPGVGEDDIEPLAREAALRFLRAFAP